MGKSTNLKKPKVAPGRVVVFAAHGDDEVLGCGGTIRRHVMDGDEVSIVIFADGETSRSGRKSKAAVAKRVAAARKAADILGAGNLFIHQLPDNRLDTVPLLDLAETLRKIHRGAAPPYGLYPSRR